MNTPEIQKRLLKAARENPPSDRVPFAFEKRIMAKIMGREPQDIWSAWASLLWRAAAPCVAIMLMLGAWSWLSPESNGLNENLATDLEKTVMAPLAKLEYSW